jgi:putative spermidine/putrescine transport system permease protein
MKLALPGSKNRAGNQRGASGGRLHKGGQEANWRPYVMVAPAALTILVVFGGGLVAGVIQSLGYLPMLGMTEITLRHYVDTLTDPRFYAALGLTFAIAAASTLLAALVAVLAAMVLRKSFWGSRVVTFLYQLPLPVPHLVAAAGLVMLLGQSGLVARTLHSAGLIDQPGDFPPIFFDRSSIGIVLVYVWKEAPFIGLVLLALLKGVALDYEEIAGTLGAGAWQRFRYVLLPLMLPGIVSTSVIVFAFMFGSFEIPLLLGARYPEVLPVMAYRLYVDPDLSRRPEAMTIGVLISLITFLLLILYRRLLRPAGAE